MIKSKDILKKKLLHFILISSVFLFITSCSTNTKKHKDHQVFRYNEHSNITSLDPAFARNPQNIWPTNQLFNGLVQLDSSLNIIPDIAKSWIISEDAMTYTFLLKKNIKFHKHDQFKTVDSTRNVTAHDFKFSFDRLKAPKIASPGRWVLNNVASYSAKNDSIFTIQLKHPFPAFLGLMSMRYCSVVPKEITTHYGSEFRAHPIGTGPFEFKLWEEGVKLVFRKNKNYFETDKNGKQLPYLEAIAITFLPDKQSEFLQFIQGNLDFLNNIDNSYKDDLLTPTGKLQEKYKDKINISNGPFLNTEYLGFFMESNTKEIASKDIRKAINYGFDREKMIAYLRNGIGSPAIHGFIPKGLPGHNAQKGYYYNPKKASQLVSKYITESGNKKPTITIGTNSQYLDICEYIQRELAKTGLRIEIDVMPPSTLKQMKSSGELDSFRASWIADYPDAENYLSLYYSKNFTPNGPNYTHFKNATFDLLYEESLMTSAIEKRKILYQKMDSIIIEEAPIVPLYYDQVIKFTQKNISGLPVNAQDFLVLKYVKKE